MKKTFQPYSLIKFFSNEEYLNDLLEGKIYCNTPEYYRLANQEGMADKNESCVVAYRKSRNDEPIKVTVDGKDMTSVISATIWNNVRKDSWLHCWFMLHFDSNVKDILQLIFDLDKVKREFGKYYVVLNAKNISTLESRLKKYSPHTVSSSPIVYSSDKNDWSYKCKNKGYEYQREFRFLFGNCETDHSNSLCFEIKEGLSDILEISPIIELSIKSLNQKFQILKP